MVGIRGLIFQFHNSESLVKFSKCLVIFSEFVLNFFFGLNNTKIHPQKIAGWDQFFHYIFISILWCWEGNDHPEAELAKFSQIAKFPHKNKGWMGCKKDTHSYSNDNFRVCAFSTLISVIRERRSPCGWACALALSIAPLR